jgi:aerobic-type carbon monoxide dehydrogenase small subunit (CoxS/CutS family)
MLRTSLPVALIVNGKTIEVAPGTTVAAAVLMGGAQTRMSAGGEARGPLCGMGICFECRVMIDGVPHQRSCQILCAPGMQVATR